MLSTRSVLGLLGLLVLALLISLGIIASQLGPGEATGETTAVVADSL